MSQHSGRLRHATTSPPPPPPKGVELAPPAADAVGADAAEAAEDEEAGGGSRSKNTLEWQRGQGRGMPCIACTVRRGGRQGGRAQSRVCVWPWRLAHGHLSQGRPWSRTARCVGVGHAWHCACCPPATPSPPVPPSPLRSRSMWYRNHLPSCFSPVHPLPLLQPSLQPPRPLLTPPPLTPCLARW